MFLKNCLDCDKPVSGKSWRCPEHKYAALLHQSKLRMRKVPIEVKRKINRKTELRPERRSRGRHRLMRAEQIAANPIPAGCEICSRPIAGREAKWDHHHGTGSFRGWLCHNCNVSLGLLGDNPAIIEAAAAYLRARGFCPK